MSKEIIEQLKERAEKPFVTAKFGDQWPEHTKRMIEEGQMSVDDVIRIAHINGRRALIMEDYIMNTKK